MSLDVKTDIVPLKRAKTHDPTGRFTPEQLALIEMFERNKEMYLFELSKIISEDSSTTATGEIKDMNVYYFIGRLNPPHLGHIKTLKNLIDTARENNGTVIILLGSGPNKGARTLDDPLPFDLKREVVIYLLGETYQDYKDKINIIEMGKSAEQISAIIQQDISNIIENINTFRFSSTKEGDDTKLNWIETAIKKREFTAPNGDKINISTNVVGIVPAQAESGRVLSATQVRVDALKAILVNNPNWFINKYMIDYGAEYSRAIYDAINILAPNKSIVKKYIQENDKNPQEEPVEAGGSNHKRKSHKRKRITKKNSKRHGKLRKKQRKTRRYSK